jgi:hypothetical protein
MKSSSIDGSLSMIEHVMIDTRRRDQSRRIDGFEPVIGEADNFLLAKPPDQKRDAARCAARRDGWSRAGQCLALLFSLMQMFYEERPLTGFAGEAQGPTPGRSRCDRHCVLDAFPSLPTT